METTMTEAFESPLQALCRRAARLGATAGRLAIEPDCGGYEADLALNRGTLLGSIPQMSYLTYERWADCILKWYPGYKNRTTR
jgi:hypothetical protein